jgi:hypothetical protein
MWEIVSPSLKGGWKWYRKSNPHNTFVPLTSVAYYTVREATMVLGFSWLAEQVMNRSRSKVLG